jgi:hypothetical protein
VLEDEAFRMSGVGVGEYGGALVPDRFRGAVVDVGRAVQA